MAVCFPLTVGVKYAINSDLNVFGEIGYRFTNTDYLDDVSTTYAGPEAFPAIPQPDGSLALRQPTCCRTEVTNMALPSASKAGNVASAHKRCVCYATLAFRSISLLINALSQTDNQHFWNPAYATTLSFVASNICAAKH